MNEEELQATIDSQAEEIRNLTAERDSLREENETLKSAAVKTADELAETKKLNFTLARQVDTGNKVDPDSVLAEMLKRR